MIEETPQDQSALYLYGIVRARTGRTAVRKHHELLRIRYRDIEAVVKPAAFALPDAETGVAEHQKVVESVMHRVTVLPSPFGVIFKGRRALIHFMQEQYLIFDEGLSLLEGHWELRLHITPVSGASDGTPPSRERLEQQAAGIYTELRRFARAAVPFPSSDDRLLSAAFLVDRMSWPEFVERIEEFGESNKAFLLDITGPWPPYDFVRVIS